ncbi:lysostaphin resistance A-like protein [Herbaspirillum sp. NPDC087042]|uniref:CPBP family intramembrane glutamic endopeptidase n=1 Tax=Herbaspirillum sp. NPDC087042 TaxID=3364004 RepID=UPI0038010C64
MSTSLLMLAICAAWLAPHSLSRNMRLAPWLALLLLALACALAAGEVNVTGVAGLIALGAAATGVRHARATWLRGLLMLLATALALLLALHRWPGFLNPLVVPRQVISANARPFALYANLDKGAAGLLLLTLLVPRSKTWQEGGRALKQALLPGLATIVVVMGLACLLGLVRPEWKWPAFTPAFLAINLLLTVVAEEAFFRGVIQHQLTRLLASVPGGALLSILVSALLFGAAHLGGGLPYAALAGVAGLGYALVFHRSGRIEGAIAVHFGLNALHFLFFSYPALA